MKITEILQKNAEAAKKYIDTLLKKKQDVLTFDTIPTADSKNPVTSDGIKKAIDAKTVDFSNYYTKTQVNTAVSTAKTEIEGKIPTVDTSLSATSANPVQNKVIKSELGKMLTKSSLDGNFCIEWDEDDNLKVYRKSAPDVKAIITQNEIMLYNEPDFTGLLLDSDFKGMVSTDSTNKKIYTLTLGKKLRYGIYGDSLNDIATEAYVQTTISNALSSITDGDSKSY